MRGDKIEIPEPIFGSLLSNYRMGVIFPPSRDRSNFELCIVCPLELMSHLKSCPSLKIIIPLRQWQTKLLDMIQLLSSSTRQTACPIRPSIMVNGFVIWSTPSLKAFNSLAMLLARQNVSELCKIMFQPLCIHVRSYSKSPQLT